MKKYFLILLIILFSFMVPGKGASYTPYDVSPLLENWRWKMISEVGDKSVRCLVEGKNQSIWFGTGKGIYYYDGLNWKNYQKENEVLSAPIYGLCYTSKDILYVISTKGICHLTDDNWSTDVIFPEKIAVGSDWEILSIKELSNGNIWAATYFGLIQIINNSIELYTSSPQILSGKSNINNISIKDVTGNYFEIDDFIVHDFIEDNSNNIWLAFEDGQLIRLNSDNPDINNPGDYTVYNNDNGLITSRLPILFESSNGNIYSISQTINGSVNMFDPYTESWSNYILSSEFGGDNLNFSISETDDGTIWIGGFSRIFTFKDGLWTEYKQPTLLVPSTRINFKVMSDGTLWMVGHLGDVIKIEYESPIWRTFRGLLYQCQSHDGTHWFISADGAVVRADKEFNSWQKLEEEFPLSDPVRIFIDSRGWLWATGSHDSTTAIAVNTSDYWQLKVFPDICWGFSPTGIFEASDKTVWIGSNPDCDEANWGLMQYNPSFGGTDDVNAWKQYKGKEICEVAYALAETDQNSLLCGYYSGLFEFNKNETRELHKVLSDDIIKVESMARDLDKGVWIGTRSQGVIYYIDDENWKQYTLVDGLASNAVSSVIVSKDSTVWVSTDKGISRFDGKNWIKFALPDYFKISRGSGILLEGNDGSIWVNNAPTGWYRRVYFLEDFNESSTKVMSYRINPENDSPETEIVKYDEKVYYPGNTTIQWKGIDKWNQTEKNELQYSYKLGKKEWSSFSQETEHSFLNMSRGKYTLQVRSRDNFLNIDSTPAVINFKVIPPVWGQLWFILLMIAFVITIFILFLSTIRKNKEKESQNIAMKQKNEELTQTQKEIDEKRKQIEQLLDKERESNWLNEGLILANNIIKDAQNDLDKLAHNLLEALINYLQLNMSAMFLLRKNGNDNNDEGYLELISTYGGYNSDNNTKKRIYIEEGLTGVCIKEKKTQICDKIPDSYYVVSGLGKSKLTSLIIVPIKLYNDIIGVFEFSSFNKIDENKIKLLEAIAENVASNILTLDSKKQIETLYKDSKEKSAILSEQEEEIRQQMEELKATQEAMKQREQELIKELNDYKNKIKKKK